jgi:Na+/H+-translocating membrane pyrophosphatase
MVGIANAYAFVWIAQYYTDTKYKPVRQVAEASTTGHATNVIAGVSIGLESTALPVLVMSAALISSYWLGNSSGKALPHSKATMMDINDLTCHSCGHQHSYGTGVNSSGMAPSWLLSIRHYARR